jgi:hypothetical protein
MKLRRNDPGMLLLGVLCVSQFLIGPGCLAASTTANPSTIPITIIKTVTCQSVGRFSLPIPFDSTWSVVCRSDSLKRGIDYRVDDSIITLLDTAASCDTLTLIRSGEYPTDKAYHALHAFKSNAEQPEPATLPETRSTVPMAATSNLQISGAKSFYADVSDQGRTNLSQGLAMTLTGDIGHGVMVRGSFSDRGLRDNRLTTKRFSELDNVYLEVESQRLRGVFGNYQFKEDRFRYLNLTRNVQGLGVKYRLGNHTIESSISVPPGNFAEYSFITADGNFGPYRLQGKNGESGIAVIENSESVWFNGVALSRGRDQDYYIDYPRGELYFTGRRAIDDQDRVRVDFEFQKSEYRKSMYTAVSANQFAGGRVKLDVGYAGLISAKNDPLDFALSDADIAVLEAAGNDVRKATVPGAKMVGAGNGDYVLQVDSTGDSVYVYVGEANGDLRVVFSQFETGDYVYLGAGRYQFAGKGKGQYLPFRSLPLPEAVQLMTVSGKYHLSNKLQFNGEAALSNYDRNRFSKRDDDNNNTVAGFAGMNYLSDSSALSGSASAEFLPQGFNRVGRLDFVDESYLWQKQSQDSGDRQRYLGTMSARFSRYDKSRLDVGFTKETGGFQSSRLSLSNEIRELQRATLRSDLAYAASKDRYGENRLLNVKPYLKTTFLPVALLARGEYDHRRNAPRNLPATSDSKRELEVGLDYGGAAVSARQRDNWQRRSAWLLLDRKRSLLLNVERQFAGRRKLGLNATVNRHSQADGKRQDYQTGALNLDLPAVLGFCDLAANLRLNRHGSFQTNKTYLKVGDGMGDYILVDSVYVAQPRGNYVLVTEQVGNLLQTIEAEKHVQINVDFERLFSTIFTSGTSLRYEVNLREIGDSEQRFQTRWLAPPLAFFRDQARFSQRNHEYRLQRFDSQIGLRSEVSYALRNELNALDINRSSARKTEQGRILFNQRLGKQDYVEAVGSAENSVQQEAGRYSLNLTRRKVTLSGSHFRGPWEFAFTVGLARERADSLELKVHTYRVNPRISYNLSAKGRIEFSAFAFQVSESRGRSVLLQMAEGFPTGANFGGNVKVDIRVSENFSLKIIGQGELRHGEANRYFLRSELVTRFQ